MIINTERDRAQGNVGRGSAQSQAAGAELCGLLSAADNTQSDAWLLNDHIRRCDF